MNGTLRERLDELVKGACPPEALVRELSAASGAAPDDPWELLALLDQYHRRGKLPVEVLRDARHRIERHVLGIPETNRTDEPPVRPIVFSLDATALPPVVDEVALLRTALVREQARSRTYRHRIAILAGFGRRQRSALAAIQRTAVTSPCRDVIRLELPRPGGQSARLRSSATLWAAAVLLSAGASADLGYAPHDTDAAGLLPRAAMSSLEPIPGAGQISLSSERFIVFPGMNSATIHVSRTGDSRGITRFKWWTEGSGARPGADYVSGRPLPAQFGAGETSLELSIPILANPQRRHTELFYVVIGDADGDTSRDSIRRAPVFIMRTDR